MDRDAHYKFFRLGMPCIAYEDSDMQVMSAALFSSDCVVIAISTTGSTRDVINIIQVAKKSGAQPIGITGREKSPLGQICDCNPRCIPKKLQYGYVCSYRPIDRNSRRNAAGNL